MKTSIEIKTNKAIECINKAKECLNKIAKKK